MLLTLEIFLYINLSQLSYEICPVFFLKVDTVGFSRYMQFPFTFPKILLFQVFPVAAEKVSESKTLYRWAKCLQLNFVWNLHGLLFDNSGNHSSTSLRILENVNENSDDFLAQLEELFRREWNYFQLLLLLNKFI